jgi:hypothetical protein
MRHTTAAAIAAGLLLALTACSSSDTDKPKIETTTAPTKAADPKPADDPKADLEKAVRAYSDAYFATDTATAYGMLSTRCRGEVTQAAYGQSIAAATKAYGKTHTIKSLTVDQMSGDMARVTYTYDATVLDQKQQPWTREGGAWRWDAC